MPKAQLPAAKPAVAAPQPSAQVPAAQPPVADVQPAVPAVATPTEPVVAVPAEPVTAVTEPAPQATVETKSDAVESKASQKQTRQQLAAVVGVSISAARIRTHLGDMGVNREVRAAQDELSKCKSYGELSPATRAFITKSKPEPVAVKPPTDASRAQDERNTSLYNLFLSGDQAAISALPVNAENTSLLDAMIGHHLLRLGDDAVTACCATSHYMIEQLATHGTKSLVSDKKKTLKTHHIANDALEQLPIWPLLRTLPSVVAARSAFKQYELDLKVKEEEKKEKEKEKRKAKKAAAAAGESSPATPATAPAPVVEQAAATPAAEQPADAESAEAKEKAKRERDPRNDFNHNAFGIISEIVKKAVGKGDVSSDVRAFASWVISELIERYVRLIRLQTEFANVKTIKASTIVTINRFLLCDEGVNPAELDAYVSPCLDAYLDHAQKAKEAPKKPKSPTPEGTVEQPAEPAPAVVPVATVAAA
jgi:hypothetical protein